MRFATLLCAAFFFSLGLTSTAQAQVSITEFVNPGCETNDGWDSDVFYCDDPALFCNIGTDTGDNAFVTGDTGDALLEQVVVPAQGAALPGKTVTFTARAADCFDTPDTGALRLEFLNSAGTTLGQASTSITTANENGYQTYSVQGVAPAGTDRLRLTVSCTENDASDFCDVIYDTMTLTTNTALPVELTTFAAQADAGAVLLRWATASETNNAGFEVQREGAGAVWATVGFVPGKGTTTEQQQYTLRVADLAPGAYRFRLRQVDLDGTASYSPVVEATVALGEAFVLLPASPNPFRGTTTLRFGVREAQPVEVHLYDVLGRQVRALYAGTPAGGTMQTVTVDADGLVPGTYVVRLTAGTHTATERLVLAR